jgi:hypothetical protein
MFIYAEYNHPVNFPPLIQNEFFEYESHWDSNLKKTIISIYRMNNANKHLLIELYGLSSNTVFFTGDKRRCFFRISDGDDTNNGLDDLWYINGDEGRAYILLKTTGAFSVSDDGRYVCYGEYKYIKYIPWQDGRNTTKLGIPIINIFEIENEMYYTLDLFDTVLNEQWGIAARIKYKINCNMFEIIFFFENRIIYTAYFDLSSKDFK